MAKSALPATAIMLSMAMAFGQRIAPKNAEELASVRQRAEAGDVKAQAELGLTYEYGFGGAQRNLSEAVKWYRRAAEQGDGDAKDSLAGMYFDGRGVEKNYSEAARLYGCPKPNVKALGSCHEISYKDLPQGALDLLTKMKCDVRAGESYDYGSAVDLNGDGNYEYDVCCSSSPHGPCGGVVIGKIGANWKDVTPNRDGPMVFTGACQAFIVLDSRHGGFNDVCLPSQCSSASWPSPKPCAPAIWNFEDGRYRSVVYSPNDPPK
jgi:hypothetical protein